MSDQLTVPTSFEDLSELSAGFVDRVDADIVILYGPVPYDDGARVEFAIQLLDGSIALQGIGSVRATVDGGDQRVPETQYDIVLDRLSFEGSNAVFFDRLVLARAAISEPPQADEAQSEEVAENIAEEESAEFQDESDSANEDADPDDIAVDDSGFADVASLDDGAAGLMRASTHSAEPPHAVPPRDPGASSGMYAHSAPIPTLSRPPEPSIDPARRVRPARFPGGAQNTQETTHDPAETAQDEEYLED